jgi:flagellin
MTSINTNMAALKSLKSLEDTSASMSTAMERLSSGLRINSAADDAAGSAISTKMEAAVRSLDVAIRNSHDAISMTQTAEGALGEVENILQRVRELAVQASNSTLSDSDRTMIQNEVTALVAEVDKIATTTNFNGVALLDGSNSNVSFMTGINASDSLSVNLEKSDANALGLGGSSGVVSYTSARSAKTDFSSTGISQEDIKLNGQDLLAADYAVDLSGVANSVETLVGIINANTGEHGAVASGFNVVQSDAKGPFVMSTTFAIDSKTIALASSYTELVANINEAASGINATLNSDNTISLSNTDGDDIVLAAISSGAGITDVGFTAGTYAGFIKLENLDGSAVTLEAATEENGYGSAATGSHTDLALFGFNEVNANIIESDIVSTTALTLDHDVKINDVQIGASDSDSAAHKADAINALTADHGVTADAKTTLEATVLFSNLAGATDVKLNGSTVDLSSTTEISSIVTAINTAQVGDIRASAKSDGKLLLTSESGVNIIMTDLGSGTGTNAMLSAANGIHGESITGASGVFTAFGNLTLTAADNSAIKISGTTADLAHAGLLHQSQELEVSSSGVAVNTLTDATNSLAKIDSAIEQVSLFRSSFGAVENRIDASINNLTTLKINTEAAQSRIEDADFAAETSALTKNQILSQAATSMLAQANASKQNLLALLQG